MVETCWKPAWIGFFFEACFTHPLWPTTWVSSTWLSYQVESTNNGTLGVYSTWPLGMKSVETSSTCPIWDHALQGIPYSFHDFPYEFPDVLIVFDSGCSQSLTSTSSRCSSFHQAAPQDGLSGHVAAGFSGISSNCSCLKVDMRNSIVTLPATMVLLEENWPSPSSWQTSGKQRTNKTTKWACKHVSKTWGIHISTEDRSCKVYRLQPCKKTCAKHWRYMYSTLVFSKHCSAILDLGNHPCLYSMFKLNLSHHITQQHPALKATKIVLKDAGSLRAYVDASEAIITNPVVWMPSHRWCFTGSMGNLKWLMNGWWMVDVLVHLKSNHPKVEPKTGDQGVAFSTMVIQCQYWRCDHFETTQRRHVRRCCEIQGREYVNLWAKAAWIVVILALMIWRMEDIVPDVGRCVIFRSRELWHETLPPRRKLWVAWKQIWSCSCLFMQPWLEHHFHTWILNRNRNDWSFTNEVLTLFAYRAWKRRIDK